MLVIAITIYCISCCIKEPMECLSLLPNYFDVPQASVYLFYFQVSASLAEKIHDLRMNCSGWEHVYKMTVYIYIWNFYSSWLQLQTLHYTCWLLCLLLIILVMVFFISSPEKNPNQFFTTAVTFQLEIVFAKCVLFPLSVPLSVLNVPSKILGSSPVLFFLFIFQ